LRQVYPELAALYAPHGGRVPDLRGMFLRGHGAQASTHYGTVTHASGSLGQLQGDAIRNITGITYFEADNAYGASGAMVLITSSPHIGFSRGNSGTMTFGITFDASRVVPTAPENRPVNMAVRYLIRARL